MSGRNISYGRGGAGNISRQQSATTPRDLVTPTIKQEVYTTGRGGSGNMVQNDPERPEIARESQDVESPPLRAQQIPHHTGRGGVANAYIPTAEEEERARLQEAELVRVRTQDRDRIKEVEHERQELRHQEPST
ncbi:uncharacterized protein N7503_009319 [Penicillium pulvis]|uniref:Uncharacterized protein n=1 Tax=Penicillium frequentans TaxID=3151616 RepID=A0AAD6CX48_9EURO|nr:uncharacterized protein N7503_009319 [Penicillium pulvis]KAJ5540341.1 hypothetical protein N7513_008673 [Penicillium glabrum]KAJ5541805.1 hypothetical protein N7494_006881 [Penicillium glabrum]KAJ5793341.1 hypothetical protein N7503_009319 [Penicillium pulvis]